MRLLTGEWLTPFFADMQYTQARIEQARYEASAQLNSGKRADFGQFLTPQSTANFMAGLFNFAGWPSIRLLDAGAGIGSLTTAFLETLRASGSKVSDVSVTLYELDELLASYLAKEIGCHEEQCSEEGLDFNANLIQEDFIENAVNLIQFGKPEKFNFAILNPPYKKIGSHSRHRLLLRQVGIETVNLYSAFVALAIALMEKGGQLVAIIPRSFCNGPYYRAFREFMLAQTAIRHIHLFAARDKAFKDDKVLQENIIILLEREAQQGRVKISTSTDDSFSDFQECDYSFEQIVFPGDVDVFFHIPISPTRNVMELSRELRYSLADIGVAISTGPVVDFRVREYLRRMPEPGCVPLFYPAHFSGMSVKWPKSDIKKCNALICNGETKKWLFPNGCYTVVRRFSSKEEKRRIVASVVYPDGYCSPLGFENHLNVFHADKHGLPEDLARGLAVFLNSTVVDGSFRRFSGHTQVNASDLRMLKYPSRDVLVALGRWALGQNMLTQEQIDTELERHL